MLPVHVTRYTVSCECYQNICVYIYWNCNYSISLLYCLVFIVYAVYKKKEKLVDAIAFQET